MDAAGEEDGVFGDAGAEAAAGAGHEEDAAKGGLAVFGDAADGGGDGGRRGGWLRAEGFVEDEPGGVFAGGGDHQQAQAGPGGFGVDAFDDGERIFDVGAAPAQAGIGDLEVAAGGGAAAADADAGGAHGEEAAGLVFGEDAGDVVVDHDHLVGVAEPLAGENADGGGAAADAHAMFPGAIDDGGGAGLDDDGGAVIDGDFHRGAVGQRQHGVAGGDALFF